MKIAKFIDISSESSKGFDDAVTKGIARAERRFRNVKNAWVSAQNVIVEDGRPIAYRVDLRVSLISN